MITAELIVNPYLLQTTAWFHHEAPCIYSEMERYKHVPLPEWIHRIPQIFYDELNGYDFVLYFTGSRSDYENIQRVFEEHEIGPDKVDLTLKKELESPREKEQQILELIHWALHESDQCPLPEVFEEEPIEALDPVNSVVLLRGPWLTCREPDLFIESVRTPQELADMELKDLPLVLYTDRDWIEEIRKDVTILLKDRGVQKDQIFFLYSQGSDEVRMTRYLQDLGLTNVQRIHSLTDPQIRCYIRDHAQTSKIRQSIQTLERIFRKLEHHHHQQMEQMTAHNRELYRRIESCEEQLGRIQRSQQGLQTMNAYVLPEEVEACVQALWGEADHWRRNKGKIRGEEELSKMAQSYQQALSVAQMRFLSQMQKHYIQEQSRLAQTILDLLSSSLDHPEEQMPALKPDRLPEPEFPFLASRFRSLSTVEQVEKQDFLNFNLFGAMPPKKPEMVSVLCADVKSWRNLALTMLEPPAREMAQTMDQILSAVQKEWTQAGCILLSREMERVQQEKEELQSHLSARELQLEQEQQWLRDLRNRLNRIEENESESL